jgi:tetratricopeptide (TPR) repeat protein
MESDSIALLEKLDKLRGEFDENGGPDLLDEAILVAQKLVDLNSKDNLDRAFYLSELAKVLEVKADGGDPEDLQRAIAAAQEAADLTPAGSEYRWHRLEDLALLIRTKFMSSKDVADLDLAISLLQSSTALMSPDDLEYRLHSLLEFAETLMQKFELSNNTEYLDQAIFSWEEGINVAQEDDPDLPMALSDLAQAREERFELNIDLDDINRAILLRERVVNLTHGDDETLPFHLADLAFSLRMRFQRSNPRNEADIHAAIANSIRARNIAVSRKDIQYKILSNLGMCLRTRFHFLGNMVDLDDSLVYLEEAAVLCSPDDPNRAPHLNNLSTTLHTKYLHTSSDETLNKAVSLLEEAVTLAGKDPTVVTNLGNMYRLRFERLKRSSDLDRAIHCLMEAEELTKHKNHEERIHCLSGLGIALLARVEVAVTPEDVENAVKVLAEAVDYESKDALYEVAAGLPSQELRAEIGASADSLSDLTNLGIAQQYLFELKGDKAALMSSIVNFEQVLHQAAVDHHRRHMYLCNLATALSQSFEMTSQLPLLDKAIDLLEGALEFPSTGHVDRPTYLSNLGNCLQTRFDYLHSIQDLDRALLILDECVNLTPAGHVDEPIHRSALGLVRYTRFKWLKNMPDLVSAISNFRNALDLSVGECPERFIYLCNLGNALRLKFEYDHEHQQSRVGDLDLAVSLIEEAVLLTVDHIYAPNCLVYLGNAVRLRCQFRSKDSDLDHAVTIFTKAVDITLDSSPQRPTSLYHLGLALKDRGCSLKSEKDVEQALRCFQEACTSTVWSSSRRYVAALQWAYFARNQSQLLSALEGYRTAISILPLLIWRGIDTASKFDALKQTAQNVSCDAASCAIELGRLDDAVELLDHGRSVFWSQLTEMRADFEILRAIAPALMSELEQVGNDLEYGILQGSDALNARLVSSKHHQTPISVKRPVLHRLAERWDALVREIRTLPGLETFLLPTPFVKLKQASKDTILVNVSIYRTDALVIDSAQPIRHIPLPNIDFGVAENLSQAAQSRMAKTRELRPLGPRIPVSTTSGLQTALATLWNEVIVVIFGELGIPVVRVEGETPLRRVWWYLTGPLTFVPIHAAGPQGCETVDVSRLVVSSYVTTLASLLRARTGLRGYTSKPKLLTVCQTTTHGQSDLPRTQEEITRVVDVLRSANWSEDAIVCLGASDASVVNVSKELDQCSWVHFACHGVQESDSPMESALLLYDGKLTLNQIASKRLSHAQFAFLSACQTATGTNEAPDEAMHLAAAFHFCGFPSVVATMWGIEDKDGPIVAEETYRYLFRGGRQHPDPCEAATALNHAVCTLRNDPSISLQRWAAFIHMGA